MDSNLQSESSVDADDSHVVTHGVSGKSSPSLSCESESEGPTFEPGEYFSDDSDAGRVDVVVDAKEILKLPPFEPVHIQIKADDVIIMLGHIHALFPELVVIRANERTPPLAIGSILTLADRSPLGRVVDIFGQIDEPMYSVRLPPSTDHGLTVGQDVFYLDAGTSVVAVDELKKKTFTDASGAGDEEVDPDFSDDELEAKARGAKRKCVRNKEDISHAPIASVGEAEAAEHVLLKDSAPISSFFDVSDAE